MSEFVPMLTDQDERALDSLHILPLVIIPLQTPGLKKAALRKAARLDSIVELFRGGKTGSGQVQPAELPSYFQDEGGLSSDIRTIEKLATLQSFDVYSLRIALRQLDIGFEGYEALQLSESMRAELTDYMTSFTRPLIQHVYGRDDVEVRDVNDIIAMLSNPDRKEALQKLKDMADHLSIEVMDVPEFLELYGDVFLSISYYRNCYGIIGRQVPEFRRWLQEISKSHLIAGDPSKKRILEETERNLDDIIVKLDRRFLFFGRSAADLWNGIDGRTFRRFRELITSHHMSVAAVLCALTVKFLRWRQMFPSGAGGLAKRYDFLMAEFLAGLNHVTQIEAQAQRAIDAFEEDDDARDRDVAV